MRLTFFTVRAVLGWVLATMVAVSVSAQTLVDRVVVRVGDDAIFLTDLKAAMGLGIVAPTGSFDPEGAALEQLIDRRLMLIEILRGRPAEPDAAMIDEEVRRMKSFAATTLKAVMEANGIDEPLLRRTARDTLRIQMYLDTRFPPLLVSDAEASAYYKAHLSAFSRNGEVMTFEQAAPAARELASMERRSALIARWLAGLKKNTEVVRPSTAPR